MTGEENETVVVARSRFALAEVCLRYGNALLFKSSSGQNAVFVNVVKNAEN
jgi:hypothetical protein